MEAPICRPDSLFSEVFFLPATWIRDVTTRLKRLLQPSDYHPLLLFHVATNDDVATKSLRSIKWGFWSPGDNAKKFGDTETVFPFNLPNNGGKLETNRRAQDINTLLWDWCFHQNFGVLNYGRDFETKGMLGPDGTHLSWRVKGLFGCKLAGLMERALN